ncbi:MAG: ATP-binding protein [Gammaproteobacteria bacterium]
MPDSLAFRITLLSLAWIALALGATALILVYYYRDHSEAYYDHHVATHLDELVAATVVDADGRASIVNRPTDPNYLTGWSGWYWEVRQGPETIARSRSLGDAHLDPGAHRPVSTPSTVNVPGPNLQPLRLQTMERWPEGSVEPVTYLASAPAVHVAEDVRDYAWHIVLSFLLLGFGLAAAVVVQIRYTLRPLRGVRNALFGIREGRTDRIEGAYPEELTPLVQELNGLLERNDFLLRRARAQVGDLAHALKNPLTVLRNELKELPGESAGLIGEQTREISGSVEHYLARARSSGAHGLLGVRTPVAEVVDDLVFAMERIHGDRRLSFESECAGCCHFGGEREDLEEMIGNLLDNACKWASRDIHLSVEDDGPGIPPSARQQVVARGARLDPDMPGHGIGLAIVAELAGLYGGSLTLGESGRGGVRATLDLPEAP